MNVKPHENKKSLNMFDNSLLFWRQGDKEFCLRVLTDDSPVNPRDNDDGHLATMACFHPKYTLGDKIDAKTPGEFWDDLVTKHISYTDLINILQQGTVKGFGKQMKYADADWSDPEDVVDLFHELVQNEMIQFAMDVLKGRIAVLPLWLYDHSGISISCGTRVYPYNDQFDSSAIGWIIMDKATAMKELGATEEDWEMKACSSMQLEVNVYDKYLTGDMYWFTLYSRSLLNTDDKRPTWETDWDEEESCSGFYGSDIYENGILENVGNGLMEALESGNYETGNAEPVVITRYKFSSDKK